MDDYDYDYLEYVLGSLVSMGQMHYTKADEIWAGALNGDFPSITFYPWGV